MKRYIILFLLLCNVALYAATPEERVKQAREFYGLEKYREAAELYESVLSENLVSHGLYYNLGNCYYRLGENARAILNYERALVLKPGDRDVRHNLLMAERQIVDKTEILPELFFVRWYKNLTASLSADLWAYIAVVLFVCFLSMVALFLYSSTVSRKKIGFVAGICILLCVLLVMNFASTQYNRMEKEAYAIVMAPTVTVRGAPDQGGTSLFVIHEGLKINMIEKLGQWVNIRLSDGNEGWMPADELEKI